MQRRQCRCGFQIEYLKFIDYWGSAQGRCGERVAISFRVGEDGEKVALMFLELCEEEANDFNLNDLLEIMILGYRVTFGHNSVPGCEGTTSTTFMNVLTRSHGRAIPPWKPLRLSLQPRSTRNSPWLNLRSNQHDVSKMTVVEKIIHDNIKVNVLSHIDLQYSELD